MTIVIRRWHPRDRRSRRLLIRELAKGIWHVENEAQNYQLKAYQDHYKSSVRLIADDNVAFTNAPNVLKLVASLKDSTQTIKELKSTLNAGQQPYLKTGANEASLEASLRFAARLWLFVPIDESMANDNLTLKQIIEQELSNVTAAAGPAGLEWLSEDFCEKNLTRKAGIEISWTSNLCEHLEMADKSHLKVFRHSSILSAYDRGEESVFYPDSFLDETAMTMALLFPEIHAKDTQRTRRIGKKYKVDIETGIPGVRTLADYPTWGGCLCDLQKAYDEARPKNLKQWYFDRRNKEIWATFWIALVAFILTVVFGMISSVTGIIQVWFAWKAL